MSNEIAKYGYDLRGGISSFAVYSKGLTENMIISNSLSSLLRVVSISGAIRGEYNEKIYDSPIFARVLPREINEIEIELRTMDKGRLVPFAYGTTMYGSGLEKEEFDYFRGSSPFQRGYGIQRGAGVGDVFRGLWRFFLPILRRVGTTVGSEALSTGQRVLERVGNEGIPLKEALVSEGKRGIDTVLEKGGLPKQFGSGRTAGYYRDTGETLEVGDGCTARRDLFALSNVAQFIAKIDTDLFNQPLYLINFCELDIEILPNDNDFVLIAPTGGRYRFEVLGLKLYVKKVSLMDGLALDIARKLELKPARYAVRKTIMKSLFISPGRYEFTANLFMDQVPRRVTMGLVSNADYRNFRCCQWRSYPQAPYDLDYPNSKYVRPFNDMNEAVGFANSSESNGITFAQYGKTHCIYVFNLTNSGDDQAALFDLIKNGTTAVSIKFNHPVPEGGIMLVVMGECDSLVMQQHQPEYSFAEYRRRLFLSKTITTPPTTTTTTTITPNKTGILKSDKLIDEQVSALLPPLIQLCKDQSEESNFSQKAVCWALFALYLMLIISLVLHQLCSIFWLKNGHYTTHKDFERKSADRTSISGLLRQ
ncbi:hypothetical protein niasHT_035570 [Heterodera trifolii]|uniref:Uncharacterized protein n=1 Tax=Heterodera trifolii TaxID=157864 RepID=A0ABD2J8B5_9BILA